MPRILQDKVWKHATSETMPTTKKVGIVLFDDEKKDTISIYLEFACGSLFPARTLSLKNSANYVFSVLGSWMLNNRVTDRRLNINMYDNHHYATHEI